MLEVIDSHTFRASRALGISLGEYCFVMPPGSDQPPGFAFRVFSGFTSQRFPIDGGGHELARVGPLCWKRCWLETSMS